MRLAALVLVLLAGAGCRRGSLQDDASGGTGSIGRDGGGRFEDGAPGPDDGPARIEGGSVESDAAAPGPDANCGMASFVSNYKPPQILLLIDQSVSQSVSDRERWNLLLMALRGTIAANGPRFDWGVLASPKAGPACSNEAVTGDIDLPLTPGNFEDAIAAVGSVFLNGNGRPTAAAIRAGTAYLRTFSSWRSRYLMLVVDGAPSCAGSIGALSNDAKQAQTDAVDAVRAAFDALIPTLVVAPEALADGDVEALNVLAYTGGAATAGPRVHYLTESTLGPFLSQARSTCTFPLNTPPPAPERVAVTLDGAAVPRDPMHLDGWDYTDARHMSLTFNGSWCEQLIAKLEFDVKVYYGCP